MPVSLKRVGCILVIAFAGVALAHPARACVISTSGLAFGGYTVSADVTSTADITLDCANGTSFDVALSAGFGTYSQRELQGDSGGHLFYNIYTSPALLQVWSDGFAAASATVSGSSTGTPVVLPAYGLIPADQIVPPGTYTDSIVVTVNF